MASAELDQVISDSSPVCSRCQASNSPVWRRKDNGAIVCLDCYADGRKTDGESHDIKSVSSEPTASLPIQPLKKKRGKKGGYRGRSNASTASASPIPMYQQPQQNRRSLFKARPVKSIEPKPLTITSESVFSEGSAYEVGDVVSILDHSGAVFYAIIRGFLVDQYADKYAILTWLLPKIPNPSIFDPLNFVLGPEEDKPYKMIFLEFVCHSPRSRHFSTSFKTDFEKANLWIV